MTRYEEEIDWDFSSFDEYESDLDGHGTKEGNVEGRWMGDRSYSDYLACFTYTPCCDEYEIIPDTITHEGTFGLDEV